MTGTRAAKRTERDEPGDGRPTFYEFFAGGGMARAGLGAGWRALFANDFDARKAASYAANWPDHSIRVADIATLTSKDLPGRADLAWASFPCQDLSVAGARGGLRGKRSGTFWEFARLLRELRAEGRPPEIVALENVPGALVSHGGKDFAAIASALVELGYRFGAMTLDAAHFVPQSRPRLFIVAVREGRRVPEGLARAEPDPRLHSPAIRTAHAGLPPAARAAWIWWALPAFPARRPSLDEVIEDEPTGVEWNPAARTRRLLELMGPVHHAKVAEAKRAGGRVVGCLYRRMRTDADGARVQRAEVRFDGVAGCLRTPAGGSSRQTILVVEGSRVRSRLLSPREAARLMGLPDGYELPARYNDAYRLAGDGVVVPVVRFLAEHLFEPLLGRNARGDRRSAPTATAPRRATGGAPRSS